MLYLLEIYLRCIGVYHQYDNMAYPFIKPDGMARRAVKWVTFGKWGSSDNKILVPDHNSMQSHSLKIYLERYENYLSTCKISNIATVIEEIMHIYQSLRNPNVVVNENIPVPWQANALHKVRSILQCHNTVIFWLLGV